MSDSKNRDNGIGIEIIFNERGEFLDKFRHNLFFPSFNQYDGYFDGSNKGQICYRYNVGNDSDLASSVISNILINVCNKDYSDFIEYENFDETESVEVQVAPNDSLKPDVDTSYFNSDNVDSDQRRVGILLALGIIFIPYVFSWLTLRYGFSLKSRIISLTWLGACVLILLLRR